MQHRFNIFVDDHSVPLDIFLHLPNYKIIPTYLVLAASDLCPRTLFISVPECDIGHGEKISYELNLYQEVTCLKKPLFFVPKVTS